MIVSKVRGGLGNQLFEWAAGYALAQANKTEFLLDLSVYGRNKVRQFQLDKLMLPFKEATEEEVEAIKKSNFYRQPFYHYDSGFSDLPDNTFLRGYFCSEQYFLGAEKQIKKMLNDCVGKIVLSEPQRKLFQLIASRESVSLHIRRGDYISNTKYNDFFGTCSLEYYHSAVSDIKNRIEDVSPLFIVFSDDLEWARENLNLDDEVIYSDVNQGDDDYLDMLFMASCKHNIIANSTFSWWSAWINSNASKMVIAPKKWFNTYYREKQKGAWIQSPYYNTKDLYPNSWRLI